MAVIMGVLRALRGDISLLVKQIRDCGRLHWPAKPSAPVTCDRFLPIKCSTERFNKDFLAKTPRPQRWQKKVFFYFSELGVLCPVEYRLDQDRVVHPKRYATGESHPLSDLFLYLWIVFVYHEAHEDHEEFTIKLYRPLEFKPRGRYNLNELPRSKLRGI